MRLEQDLSPCWWDWEHGNTQPAARIQRRFKNDGYFIEEFCFQLEYNVSVTDNHRRGPNFQMVARFDHDVNGPHDVRYEGLHMDVYTNGRKERIERGFPEMEFKQTPKYALNYLQRYHETLLADYEQRCQIPINDRVYWSE